MSLLTWVLFKLGRKGDPLIILSSVHVYGYQYVIRNTSPAVFTLAYSFHTIVFGTAEIFHLYIARQHCGLPIDNSCQKALTIQHAIGYKVYMSYL